MQRRRSGYLRSAWPASTRAILFAAIRCRPHSGARPPGMLRRTGSPLANMFWDGSPTRIFRQRPANATTSSAHNRLSRTSASYASRMWRRRISRGGIDSCCSRVVVRLVVAGRRFRKPRTPRRAQSRANEARAASQSPQDRARQAVCHDRFRNARGVARAPPQTEYRPAHGWSRGCRTRGLRLPSPTDRRSFPIGCRRIGGGRATNSSSPTSASTASGTSTPAC